MTRKSAGRLKRDELAAAAKANGVVSPYVELDEMYNNQREMFKKYYEMATLVIHPAVVPFFRDVNEVNRLMQAIAVEVKDLHARTEQLHDMHKGKNALPNAVDEDEHFVIIQMFQQYQAFFGVHNQNILPLMLEVQEHIDEALRTKAAAQATAVATIAAADQADLAITQVQSGGMTYNADAQGNPVPQSAAPTMDGYEAAATVPN